MWISYILNTYVKKRTKGTIGKFFFIFLIKWKTLHIFYFITKKLSVKTWKVFLDMEVYLHLRKEVVLINLMGVVFPMWDWGPSLWSERDGVDQRRCVFSSRLYILFFLYRNYSVLIQRNHLVHRKSLSSLKQYFLGIYLVCGKLERWSLFPS